jgi:hypothetical protein
MEGDMATEQDRLDSARESVLDRMETGQKLVRIGMSAAALLELAMLAACILLVDWGEREQVLLFVIFILSYFILVLGMLALAGHVTSATARILAVLEAREP